MQPNYSWEGWGPKSLRTFSKIIGGFALRVFGIKMKISFDILIGLFVFSQNTDILNLNHLINRLWNIATLKEKYKIFEPFTFHAEVYR